MSSEQYLGCTVSIEVGGGLGYYQGQVKNVNSDKQTITICKVLHNGKPIQTPEVTISGPDILSLKLLKSRQGENLQSTNDKVKNDDAQKNQVAKLQSSTQSIAERKDTYDSQVETLGFKRKSRTSVGESLASGSAVCESREKVPNMLSSTGPSKKPTASVLYQQLASSIPDCFSARNGTLSEANYQRRNNDMLRTPNRKQNWRNFRDESTFGTPIDNDILNTEFDFERNLALFDKQAVIEEIQNLRPDVVRHADKRPEKNYRCDQNVLTSNPKQERQIIVPPSDAGEIIYATDNGLLVPSVTADLRQNLLSSSNQHGLTKSRQLEMIGRGATEIILSVIGGSHRLEPGNSHQAPVVVIFSGAHLQGAAGINCGRQLESQGVETILVTPSLCVSPPPSLLLLSHEMQLYNMTNGRTVTDTNALPSTVDLIVDARFDLMGNLGVSAPLWTSATSRWASASRAPIISLDPPSDMTAEQQNSPSPRIKLCPGLPLSYLPHRGKVYLLNLNIPYQVFSGLGIKYTPPFGAKMVVPLHPCE